MPPPGLLAELWAPVGLRYHALHHLLPSLPYHSLPEAHRRLAAQLGSGSTYANFGPAIRLPLFEGGRLRGRYDSAAAGYEEAVARYDQSLLAALREVADTLESRRDLAGRLASARAADAAAQEAARLVTLRRKQGIASQLQVLAAEDTALGARRLGVELEARAYLLDVMLTKALGGGFTAPPRPLGNN